MKEIITYIFVLISLSCFSQEHFYYKGITKVPLDVSQEKILVKFKDQMNLELKNEILSSKEAALERKLLGKKRTTQAIDKNDKDYINKGHFVRVRRNITKEEILKSINNLGIQKNVLYASPFYKFKDGTTVSYYNEFVVKLKEEERFSELNKLLAANKCKISRRDDYNSKTFYIRLDSTSKISLLEAANVFFESGLFEYSEPCFIRILRKQTGDPNYTDQWSIENTGQNGGTVDADMDVNEAWPTATGSGIKVALLDEGVDLAHPDIGVLTGYDATGNGSNGGPLGSNAHGTACAGIIGAKKNSIGGVGIAYDSEIIPIRIGITEIDGNWLTTDAEIKDGIRKAYIDYEADILNNSWGGGPSSSDIEDALVDAVKNGRDGKGCLVFVASGNYIESIGGSKSVNFPASINEVIAVGATSMCNERKKLSSCDGEDYWESKYGSALDIMAPGVKIFTTDNRGVTGYTNTDYNSSFNGTSSACPNAAGVGALVFSVNPELTAQEARDIIESTCMKVGSYSYANTSGHPNGTWNNEMGYGLVNAKAAVDKATSTLGCIPDASFTASKTSIYEGESITFKFNGSECLPDNYGWSFPGGSISNSSKTEETVVFNTPGNYTITLITSNEHNTNSSTKTITVLAYKADFYANGRNITPGQSISFTNNSTSKFDTYTWTFPGGTPTTSNEKHPSVTYNTEGIFGVTLIASSSSSGISRTEFKANFINVSNDNSCEGTVTILEGENGDMNTCFGESISLNAVADIISSRSIYYKWYIYTIRNDNNQISIYQTKSKWDDGTISFDLPSINDIHVLVQVEISTSNCNEVAYGGIDYDRLYIYPSSPIIFGPDEYTISQDFNSENASVSAKKVTINSINISSDSKLNVTYKTTTLINPGFNATLGSCFEINPTECISVSD